jgi:transcriptional regulator with XRE-family HTH domain
MVSSEQFIEKIEQILNYYNLSASQFAEKIGVQRSSLSHLLSGRNKPSLDFVIKIVEEFPEVDLYWFLFNQGEFPKVEIEINSVDSNLIDENPISENKKNENSNITINREILPLDLFSTNIKEVETKKVESSSPINIKELESEHHNRESINNVTKHTLEENPIENLGEKKLSNQIPKVEQENNNLNQEFKNINQEIKNIPIKETNEKIPKVETKYPAKVKKLMLLYEDGFFEEYNYR